MIHTLLGEENFQGCNFISSVMIGAATCDDFVQAMEDASNVDLSPISAVGTASPVHRL